MPKQINVGVVGCGYWGPNLIRNFRALPDCGLKMMCDLNEQRLAHLKGLYPEVTGETDYNAMLNGADLDAIAWMNQLNQIDPSKSFFCYYVPGATHAPHHPTKEWVDKIHAMHLFDDGY